MSIHTENENENEIENREAAEFDTEQAIKYITNSARTMGVESLILGIVAKEGGLITTHIENIKTSSAFNVLITLFNQLCNIEASRVGVPVEYTKEIEKLRDGFNETIREFSKVFENDEGNTPKGEGE